jgi:hypothetical protein
MVGTTRATRILVALLVAVFTLGVTATSAAAAEDEGELIEVEKTVEDLNEEMAKLRQRGERARKGELSAAAICGDAAPQPIFSSWGDESGYVPAPEGDTESTHRWKLNKHARRLARNSPFSRGTSSLLLEDNGVAITPPMCVSTLHPTIRLFAADTSDDERSRLEVEILYENTDGKLKRLKVAKLRGGRSWGPTTIVPLYVSMLGAAHEDGFTAIAIKFKAKDAKSDGDDPDAGWMLDDLYVDPLKII